MPQHTWQEFKLAYVVRATTTPGPGHTEAPEKHSNLSPQLVDAAVSRLCWITLICAVLAGSLVYLQRWLQPETADVHERPIVTLLPLVIVLVSIAINVVARYRL